MVHCSWIGNDSFSFADLEIYQKRCSTEKSPYTFEYQHDVIPVYDVEKLDLRPSSIMVRTMASFWPSRILAYGSRYSW